MYHSMKYLKQKTSISYFIQYSTPFNEFNFVKVVLFFTLHNRKLALIQSFINYKSYSTYFKQSCYYNLIKKPIDLYYFMLKETNTFCVLEIDNITTYLIPFKNGQDISTIIVTPVYCTSEHD